MCVCTYKECICVSLQKEINAERKRRRERKADSCIFKDPRVFAVIKVRNVTPFKTLVRRSGC